MSKDLAKSLLRLHTKNLSSLDADPIYATYHFSHPHVTERLKALGWTGEEKVLDGDVKEGVVKASGRDEL